MTLMLVLCLFCHIGTADAYKQTRLSVDSNGDALELVANSSKPRGITKLNVADAKAYLASHHAPVISKARKFVLHVPSSPIPAGRSGTSPFFYSKPLELASTPGAPLMAWTPKGAPPETARGADKGGLIWRNGEKDQGVAADGKGIVIFNVDNGGQQFLTWARTHVEEGCCKKISQVLSVMQHAFSMRPPFTDVYDSSVEYRNRSFVKLDEANLYEADKKGKAFAIEGKVQFQGTAGGTHETDHGCVIVVSGDSAIHVEKVAFQRTYLHPDGSPFAADGFPWDLPVYTSGWRAYS